MKSSFIELTPFNIYDVCRARENLFGLQVVFR
jgi:hypothetical protein